MIGLSPCERALVRILTRQLMRVAGEAPFFDGWVCVRSQERRAARLLRQRGWIEERRVPLFGRMIRLLPVGKRE